MAEQKLPVHVYWARLLLSNIINGNGYTKYEHTNGPVEWGPTYVSITDCSGFINALLIKSYNLQPNWSGHVRNYASTYYRMINEDRFFTKINNIFNIQIGDFITFKILPGTSKTDNTGHIMMVNADPEPIVSIKPIISGTKQFSVNIIDQSEMHGSSDTRSNTRSNGLGSGYLRIYTDYNGNLVGYSWSTNPGSKFIGPNVHPMAVGRFRLS